VIIKSYDLSKINLNEQNIILFYGKNEGLKKSSILTLTKNLTEIYNYEEKEILENAVGFLESVLTKSLFEDKKFIIIKRATDKLIKIIEEIDSRKIKDNVFLFSAENLEKKSKLRSFFEKSKKNICVAFYPDNERELSNLAYSFFKERNISISPSNINIIIGKCNGDRENLINELEKIENFISKGSKLTPENIAKLVNLNENFSITELIDNCLAKNKKKIIKILNENNFYDEDSITITRVFLNKSKKVLMLLKDYQINKNIDLTISSAKPPIFWKDKEIVKQQINMWSPEKIRTLIYRLNELELIIKKNLGNSIKIITDFILEQSSSKSNS
tara:strand:+ start:1004 stop:1996 length:993 start_codon:yes stop_codon:yes gene_type:complete